MLIYNSEVIFAAIIHVSDLKQNNVGTMLGKFIYWING